MPTSRPQPRLGQFAPMAAVGLGTLLLTVDVTLLALNGRLPSSRTFYLLLAVVIVLFVKVLADQAQSRTAAQIAESLRLVLAAIDDHEHKRAEAAERTAPIIYRAVASVAPALPPGPGVVELGQHLAEKINGHVRAPSVRHED